MSSHSTDASGQRPLTTTINDPAATKTWMPGKPGDDVEFSFGNGREILIALHDGVRVQRRLVKKQVPVRVDGKLQYDGDNPNPITEEKEELRLVLAVGPSMSGFIRSSATPDMRGEDGPTELYTHTSLVIRRRSDDEWHYLEDGELIEEMTLGELMRSPEVG